MTHSPSSSFSSIHDLILGGSVQDLKQWLEAFPDDLNALSDEEKFYNQTPLFLAASHSKHALASFLIQSGADLNETNFAGESALFKACEKGDLSMLQLLLVPGIDLYPPCAHLKTPFDAALTHHHYLPMVKALLDHGYDVNFLNDEGNTPLMFAAMLKDVSVLDLCIKAGADPHQRDSYSNTVFMHVCQFNPFRRDPDSDIFRLQCLSLLIEYGVDINAQGQDDNTALHYAIYGKRPAVIRFLVEQGVLLDLKNSDGQTPFELAQSRDYVEMARYLKEASLIIQEKKELETLLKPTSSDKNLQDHRPAPSSTRSL